MDSDSRVELRSDSGIAIELPSERIPAAEAMRWAYVAGHRSRWRRRTASPDHDSLATQAQVTLELFGVGKSQLDQLATASVVQVSSEFSSEAAEWKLRVLPWEFLLASATRGRRSERFTVVRHLHRHGGQLAPARTPTSLLTVDAQPDGSTATDSELEHRLMTGFGELEPAGMMRRPTAAELKARLERDAPDVVHVSGLAPSEMAAERIPSDGDASSWKRDGVLLRADNEQRLEPAGAHAAALLLTCGRPSPFLVTVHTAGSAARVAALAVANGADAAIGFQDRFDVASAQLLFATLAQAGRLGGWDLLAAFCVAIGALRRSRAPLRGTGVVLWSARPLLSEGAETVTATIEELESRVEAEQQRTAIRTGVAATAVRDTITTRVRPIRSLNFALLHNRRSLFESFRLIHHAPGTVRDVQVEVALHLGDGAFPYRCTLDLTEPVTDLTDRIRLPLTAHLLRSIEESVHTSLFVHITVATTNPMEQPRTILRDTYPVRLLPPDEWRDTDSDRQWLPSFVLPRDPAVAHTIDTAHRHLVVLADDPHRGFDGFQRTIGGGNPEAVDVQVRAVWSCLLYDVAPRYINPPPVYTPTSQRLRRPSEVVEGQRGTCIDLALLLAACLEYLEIYPVVFLLAGHAFPGYWRSWEAYAAFQDVVGTVSLGDGDDPPSLGGVSTIPWVVGADAYREIVQQVVGGQLVPLETVDLTRALGFFSAVEDGERHLGSRFEFQAMVDITRARECGVTPLPIGGCCDG